MSSSTSKTKTIDNYGVGSSRRYAADQKLLGEQKEFLESARTLGGIATVSVTSPYPSSDFEKLYSITQKNQSWANFASPKNFNANTRSIFSYLLIPSLGSYEELENLRDKFKRKKKKKKENDSILNLLDCILELGKNHAYIRDRRDQYHKG